ncbi:hypothetical protein EDB84DRAFT_1442278 [Lactarius hengduanensis]|nr:hypothetical protein EDB84DRAFT_1442278 [Lactarius hengduanensis]
MTHDNKNPPTMSATLCAAPNGVLRVVKGQREWVSCDLDILKGTGNRRCDGDGNTDARPIYGGLGSVLRRGWCRRREAGASGEREREGVEIDGELVRDDMTKMASKPPKTPPDFGPIGA